MLTAEVPNAPSRGSSGLGAVRCDGVSAGLKSADANGCGKRSRHQRPSACAARRQPSPGGPAGGREQTVRPAKRRPRSAAREPIAVVPVPASGMRMRSPLDIAALPQNQCTTAAPKSHTAIATVTERSQHCRRSLRQPSQATPETQVQPSPSVRTRQRSGIISATMVERPRLDSQTKRWLKLEISRRRREKELHVGRPVLHRPGIDGPGGAEVQPPEGNLLFQPSRPSLS